MRMVVSFLALSLVALCSTTASGTEGTIGVVAQLDDFLTQAYPADEPGAAVLVVSLGQILLRKGYGMANLEMAVPIHPEDVFRLGSITKQFTAVAILQLVEAGKIRLDDEVGTYLPEFQSDGSKITLRHLLTHTSGLPNFTSFHLNWAQDITLPQLLALIKMHPATFAPGTDWAYSNTGYWLLGVVIERVSGQSYGEYVETHIFRPAQMIHSSYDFKERIIPHRVTGYTRGAAKVAVSAPYISMITPFAAGGLLSSVDDLWRWEQALAAGKLVSTSLLSAAYTPARLTDGRSTGYGFGWGLGTLARHPTVEHNGGITGFHTDEIRIPDADLYVVVLCNSDRPLAQPEEVAQHLASLVLGNPAPINPIKIASEQLQKFTGVFRLENSVKVEFDVKAGTLFVNGQRGYRFPLAALSATEFIAPDNDGDHYTFISEPTGNALRLIWHPPSDREVYGKRVDEQLNDSKNASFAVSAEILDRYVGDYKMEGAIVTLKRAGEGLKVQSNEENAVDLVAESNVRFHALGLPVVLEFRFDLNGRVTGYVVIANDQEYSAIKIE